MKLPKECKIEQVASTDKTRHVLANPYLDRAQPDKPVLVGTNGNTAVSIPVECDDSDTAGFITCGALKAARALTRKGQPLQIQADVKQTLTDGTQLLRPTGDEIGQFPNWRQVFPAANRPCAMRVSFNVSRLAAIAEAMGTDCVILEIETPTLPLVVRPTSQSGSRTTPAPDAVGVFMPIRVS